MNSTGGSLLLTHTLHSLLQVSRPHTDAPSPLSPKHTLTPLTVTRVCHLCSYSQLPTQCRPAAVVAEVKTLVAAYSLKLRNGGAFLGKVRRLMEAESVRLFQQRCLLAAIKCHNRCMSRVR